MGNFNSLRRWLAQRIAPAGPVTTKRMYGMARQSRLTAGWGNATTSEDQELLTSLTIARNRSRALVRDAAYAKRAKVIVQNNVVGSGIGLQAQVATTRGALNERINDEIEAVWKQWTNKAYCHTGRSLSFAALERAVIGQVFEAGEVLLRKHRRRVTADSPVPFVLELIEAERIADTIQLPAAGGTANIRLGIEVDEYCAPVAYYIRSIHPGDLRAAYLDQSSTVERVPAADILHIRIIDRWPSTRSMPWMHAAARKLNDMDGMTEAEITAARAAACYMGFIETPDGTRAYGETQPDGSVQSEIEPNIIERLNAGEKFTFAAPNRPNTQMDPFMRMMLREVAAGTGSSYESLSRDYSQSNYSSSRLALLDDKDLWRTLQCWFIEEVRQPIHREWMQAAVLSGVLSTVSVTAYGLEREKFEAVRFKPRGWSWIDPTKEVAAYKDAVLAGFMTVSDVIQLTGSGRDLEDVLKERRHELDRMEELDLLFTTDPETVVVPMEAQPAASPPSPKEGDDGDEEEGDEEEGDDEEARLMKKLESLR